MPTQKRLKSVIQSIAHHAVSGLSFIHPHLAEACKAVGLSSVRIDLLAQNPCPEQFRNIEPLQLSLTELSHKFLDILNKEGFNLSDLKSARLFFSISNWDDYSTICDAQIVSYKDRTYEYRVDFWETPNKCVEQTA